MVNTCVTHCRVGTVNTYVTHCCVGMVNTCVTHVLCKDGEYLCHICAVQGW